MTQTEAYTKTRDYSIWKYLFPVAAYILIVAFVSSCDASCHFYVLCACSRKTDSWWWTAERYGVRERGGENREEGEAAHTVRLLVIPGQFRPVLERSAPFKQEDADICYCFKNVMSTLGNERQSLYLICLRLFYIQTYLVVYWCVA